MPIDKRIPRVLNSDLDNKAIDKVSMLDALNLYSGPDNEGFSASGNKSDAGAQILKNIKGNLKVFEVNPLPSSARLIGSVEDPKTDITYLFVFSSQASSQGIWAYDRYGKLPGSQENSLRLIYKSKQFNFSSNAFVKADIVYSNATRSIDIDDPAFDKDAIIYFTDGENEPRKINAYRALQAGGANIHGADTYAEADFITACPKTPLTPITFKFDNEPGVTPKRSVNNFERSPGFQFAYQHMYIDGAESSISPYSDIAIPYTVTDQGSQTYVNHPNYRCLLDVPAAGPEVKTIRILGRQGNSGSFLVIDEIEASEQVQQYPFFNDRILRGVSTDEVNKQFDSVPRKAKTQALSSNRLMYGNYLDGFDKSNTTAVATVRYLERPQDFLDFNIDCIPSSYHDNGINENAAFILDFSQLPDSFPAETQISVNFSFSPDRNFHLYNVKGAGQSRQRGPQPLNPYDEVMSGVNFEQSQAATNEQNGALNFDVSNNEDMYLNGSIWGQDFTSVDGVNGFASWRNVDYPNINGYDYSSQFQARTQQNATFGTSAASPFIFKGGTIEFSAELVTTQEITDAREKIKQAVITCFTVPGLPENTSLSGLGISVVSNQAEPSYSFNLGLSSGDTISQYYVGQGGQSPHENSDRIVAVHGNLSTANSGVPTGFFIVNKATPTFRLNSLDDTFSGYLDLSPVAHFSIKLKSFQGAEWLSCIRETATSSFQNVDTKWLVISNADLNQMWTTYSGIESWMADQGYGDDYVNNHQGFGNAPGVSGQGDDLAFRSYSGYGLQVGRLQAGVNELLNLDGDELVLVDGEGGPGGGPAKDGGEGHPYDALKMYAQGSVTCAPLVVEGFDIPGMTEPETLYNYLQTAFYAGLVSPSAVYYAEFEGNALGVIQQNSYNAPPESQRRVTTLPFLRNNGSNGFKYELPNSVDGENSELEEDSVNFKRNQTIVEVVGNSGAVITLPEGVGFSHESFKTEANHDFGIVYYDERGRHGFVDHLDTAFVEGYSDQERGSNKGRVEIDLALSGEPPEWAHTYKIVYAKNSSVQDFVQYSVGGAFVIDNPDDVDFEGTNRNIYVSLNYLQGHPISYVSSFGARTPEGGLNFYKFEEGDKLRVISHGPSNSRVYEDYEFDVADLVILGSTDNPISIAPLSNQKGQFVVLKDNPNAIGFNFDSVSSAASNNWNRNCIVELRTPKKVQDVDEQVYYESSPSYRVLRNEEDQRFHEVQTVTIDRGDVWFRPVATNVKDFINGDYQDIILDDDGNDAAPQPNFTNVFMETVSANDLFRSDAYSYVGRPNFIFDEARETVREATITYSDPSNPEGSKLNYSSFNASLANYKDLPERFGSIQYMSDYEDFMFVLQEDKVSIVPVNRNILSDASGNNTIIASREILGKAVFYPGRNGCDNDPSSVFDSGEEAYFCNKTLSKVYRWSKGSGVEEISDKGISSMIRASVQRVISQGGDVRIVGGYDPLKDEYLFTLLNPAQKSVSGVIKVLQPLIIVVPGGFDGDEGNEGDEPSTNNISVDVDSIEFTEAVVGETSEKQINIFGEGTNVVFVSRISSSDSSVTFPRFTPFYIDPSEISTPFTPVEVVFNPIEPGEFSAEITIETESTTNQSVVIPVTSTVLPQEDPEIELSTFQQAFNDFYEQNPGIPYPENYPLTSDDQMSAELAIQYLIDLKEADPSLHPTYEQMEELVSQAGSTTFKANIDSADSDWIINANDLTSFLGAWQTGINPGDSFFNGTQYSVAGGTNNQEGNPPALGGGTPIPVPSDLFGSTQDALDFLVEDASMTVAQFHFLNNLIKPKIKADFNGDGIVGTDDLMDLLQYYALPIPGAGDPAFINPAPVELEGEASGSAVPDALFWLLTNGSDMTAGQYWGFASNIRKDVKTDINGDGIVGQNDHTTVLSEWSVEQPEEPATPLDPNTLAFN